MGEKTRGQKSRDIFMLRKYLLNMDLWAVIRQKKKPFSKDT